VTLELELSPSRDDAVTVTVCVPVVVVSSAAPDAWPFWSTHDEIPAPPAASVQLKLEPTTWLSEYIAPRAGTAIAELGADGTVYVSVTWGLPVAVCVPQPLALQ
jgi:hypothetical protein